MVHKRSPGSNSRGDPVLESSIGPNSSYHRDSHRHSGHPTYLPLMAYCIFYFTGSTNDEVEEEEDDEE